MADDDVFGDEPGKIGSEAWRARFFHDMRQTMRSENEAATDILKHAMRQIIDSAVESLRTSRVHDTAQALQEVLDITPEDKPVLVDVVHNAIRSRRVRQEQWANFRGAIAGSAWEIFKHALTVAALGAAGWLAATSMGGWPHWLK